LIWLDETAVTFSGILGYKVEKIEAQRLLSLPVPMPFTENLFFCTSDS
jgi:hypothetical protein